MHRVLQKHALGAEQQKKEEEGCKRVKERESWAHRQQVYMYVCVLSQKAVLSVSQKYLKKHKF